MKIQELASVDIWGKMWITARDGIELGLRMNGYLSWKMLDSYQKIQ